MRATTTTMKQAEQFVDRCLKASLVVMVVDGAALVVRVVVGVVRVDGEGDDMVRG